MILYVFVDESGRASTDDYYTVAATWCVSTATDETTVLAGTKDRCLSHLDGTPSELKGSAIQPDQLDVIVPCIDQYAGRDDTVTNRTVAWTDSNPLKHTIQTVQPRILADLLEIGVPEAKSVKTLSLTTVLDPLFRPERLELTGFSEIRLILDAETWQPVIRQFESVLGPREAAHLEAVSFETRDSNSTPGIQISDLTAYSWARNRRKGDCQQAVNSLADRRFDAL